MGTRIPSPPIEYGIDCDNCTPFRWAVGETPKYVYVYFDGLTDCGWSPHPSPNGQTFKLTQSPIAGCHWFSAGDPWIVNFYAKRPGAFQSRIELWDHHGFSFFIGHLMQCPLEYWTYANLQAACILMYAASGGTATVFWSDQITTLIEQFGLVAGRELFYEMFQTDGPPEVHKFCDRHQRTNIKFKI